MRTKTINLSMHEDIENIRIRNGGIASPFSFVSLYAWRDIIGAEIFLEDNIYSLKFEDGNDNSWIFPCGGKSEKKAFLDECLKNGNVNLYYVRSEDKEFLKENYPGRFEIERRDDFDEYIYNTSEQIELKGNRFHRFRNRINNLLNENSLSTKLLDDSNIDDATKVIKQWALDKYEVGNLNTRGDEIDEDVLRKWKELSLSGVVIYSGERAIAVAAGYYLSEDMYDVLLCKASERLKGIHLYCRRELIRTLSDKCTKVDLEDDMGLNGLRTMKEEMHPVKKIEMWKATSV